MTDEKTSDSGGILSRFSGETGQALLLDTLSDMSLLRGVPNLAEFLRLAKIFEVRAGSRIIEQGAADNSIFIIVSGAFRVLVNGREVAIRKSGAHVGEMALIDPTARRSATVVALEDSLVLECSEEKFTAFADLNPRLWRRIATDLSRRLIERNRYIKVPRTEPAVFIGCSTEAVSVAREIQSAFSHDPAVVEIWTDGIFHASNTPIEDLTELISRIDFALLILTPDDEISSRNTRAFGPRDNVIFELGLAIGSIGRSRTIAIMPRGESMKIPTDLLGVKGIDFPPGTPETLGARLGPACTEIRKIIQRLGPI